ncbi:hypothetical protein [Streptomyces fragilis]|uniref:DUF779 domain-containing protein n=1 Tax=Streptomyces fragilis TaxID=67301 RepID=A0ABV2YK17_9ACTN|nr:hypothetical protein [Streptomyces fragilis]
MNHALPADVTEALDAVLGPDNAVHAALRAQIPHLTVRTRCTCGCGSAYFQLDTETVERAPTGPGTAIAAEARFVMEDGTCPGEVLVFVQDGHLSWLEVCTWSDDTEVSLATTLHRLRPVR